MQVSDADCKKVDDVLKAHPKEKKQLDDLRAKMQALRPAGFGGNRSGNGGGGGAGVGGSNRTRGDSSGVQRPRGNDSTGQRRRGGGGQGQGGAGAAGGGAPGGGGGFRGSPEMMAINEQMRAIYTALSLDARTAGACARRQQGGGNAQAASGRGGAGGQGTARAPGGGQSPLTPSPELGARAFRPKTGLVFVSDSAKTHFAPRIVQLGQGNLDFTEAVSGLKEGERVVMLGALALQAQRQQQQDRMRQNASPLGGQPGPGGGPGGPGGGGGGPRGGGGGGGRGG
jgi:hypothetical protein